MQLCYEFLIRYFWRAFFNSLSRYTQNFRFSNYKSYLQGEDSGCWSYVGRSGGRQTLNLQRSYPGNGCFRNGTIVHEFLHAAGFFHQQSAPERDDYVEIVWENIQPGKLNWQPLDGGLRKMTMQIFRHRK